MTKPELELYIQEYGTALYSFCRYLTSNVQEAEDLYQDTFLKAMELNEKIDALQNPKGYLLAVAVRIWKNRKRKYAWRKRIVDEQVLPENRDDITYEQAEASPEEQLLCKEEIQAVREAVQKLPKRLQVIVLLYYMESLSVAQVASVVKIPKGTVKSRLHQARKLLEKELEVVLNEKRS